MPKYRCKEPLTVKIVGGSRYNLAEGDILDFEFQTEKITALENSDGRICVPNAMFEKYFELAE